MNALETIFFTLAAYYIQPVNSEVMSKKKEEWNPFDTMSEEYMKSIKSDVDFSEAIYKCVKKRKRNGVSK